MNRLVQVNVGTDLDVNDFAATGRLIRTVRQDPNAAAEAEDYYYDGVRRIQEVVTDPGDPNTPLVTRNYVWGPGYVDEILARRDDVPDQLGTVTYFSVSDEKRERTPAKNGYEKGILVPAGPAGAPSLSAPKGRETGGAANRKTGGCP